MAAGSGFEPQTAAVVRESVCRGPGLLAHPTHCDQYIACQPGRDPEHWISTPRHCSPGTVFDTELGRCNFQRLVPRCHTGTGPISESQATTLSTLIPLLP